MRLLDEDLNVLQETVSDESGYYFFTNVAQGNYRIEFVYPLDPGALVFTLMDQGENDELDSDVAPETGLTDAFFIEAATVNTTIDAGLIAYTGYDPQGGGFMMIGFGGKDGDGDSNEPSSSNGSKSQPWWLGLSPVDFSGDLQPFTIRSATGRRSNSGLQLSPFNLEARRRHFDTADLVFVG